MDVPSITATIQTYGILLEWVPVTDFDFDHYEIRVGASWAAGTVLDRAYTNTFRWNMQTAATYNFWIKAVDAFGNYSVNPATASAVISTPSSSFMIFLELVSGPTR